MAATLSLGLATPARADAIVMIMFKNARGEFKPVEARLQRGAMSMFDCRAALDAGAGEMLVRQLSDPEKHPDLVGWRVSLVECRQAR